MKIAHVCPFYDPAICGVKQVVKELAVRQRDEGHEVHIYTSDWDKYRRVERYNEVIDGIHIHRSYHLLRFGNFATLWPQVFFKLLNKRFDIIHSHVYGHPHFVFAGLVTLLTKTKHIHTTHCPWTDSNRSRLVNLGIFISYNTLSRFVLRFTDKIIAITPWEVPYIKKYGGTNDKINILPNGVDNKFFTTNVKDYFKTKYNINEKVVLFLGRLSVTKGVDKFAEIAKEVIKEVSDVVFVMIGPDEGMRSKVEDIIGDEKRIIILEPVKDRTEVSKLMNSASIFLLPSFREGLPLTLMEAMASGLPVIATPVNGVSYEMQNEINGYLINYGDNKTFVEKIKFLLANIDVRNEISIRNKTYAQKYNWDKIYIETMKLY